MQNLRVEERHRLTVTQAATIFLAALLYLVLLLFLLLPWLRAQPGLHPATHWYLIGYALFPPMIVFALRQVRREGADTFPKLLNSLGVRRMTGSDWIYAIAGIFAVLVCTGIIFASWSRLASLELTPPLEQEPWCIDMSPLEGQHRWLLLLWVPMFVLNIVGEELLWRGYVQSRLNVRLGWLICGMLWLVFHVPFGIPVMILSLPLMLILPFVFDRTRNTTAVMLIHGMYNGPAFLASAFGLLP